MYYPCFCGPVAYQGGQVGEKALGHINTIFNHLKMRNLDQTMPKNAYLLEKKLKNCRNVGGSALNTLATMGLTGESQTHWLVV